MEKRKEKRLPLRGEFKKISNNLSFVLVEPETPGNIGACARALKTSGFKNLIIVNSARHLENEARWMAHQSEDILDNARLVSSLDEAIGHQRLVIATTQRKRHFKFPFYTPLEVAKKIGEVAVKHPVAIVFGRESSGLTNEELTRCHLHSTILTATKIPALNLAQSVMIYANTFFQALNIQQSSYTYDLASQRELEELYKHLQQSMQLVGFVPRDNIDNFVTRFKRLLGRSMAEKRDVRLLHKLLQIFEKRIQTLESKIGNEEERKPIF